MSSVHVLAVSRVPVQQCRSIVRQLPVLKMVIVQTYTDSSESKRYCAPEQLAVKDKC